MSWNVRFTALADDDVSAAHAGYASTRADLGDEFLADVEKVIDKLAQFPEAGPLVHHELRRALLSRFPYSLYYRLVPILTTIEVRACVHQKRHPRTWRRRV